MIEDFIEYLEEKSSGEGASSYYSRAFTGIAVTIKGANFNSATGVTFGNIGAQSFAINSDSVITAIVGTGASGRVKVTNQFGTDSLQGFTFIPPLLIFLSHLSQ